MATEIMEEVEWQPPMLWKPVVLKWADIPEPVRRELQGKAAESF